MQIVRELAGYSYGRSDLVRRAMSKKKASVMEKERKNFVYGNKEENVKGCIANGIDENVAMHIFDEMTDFASYAFNKSHAAAYAVVSYRTAYLKCYFPIEFMAALMTSVMGRTDKIAEYTMHLRQLGIDILPPSINEGFGDFSTGETGIRYGMSAIKSIGRPVIDAIVGERKNGRYKDFGDFAKRISGTEVNKKAIENLIKAGAMDDLYGNRHQKMMMYSQIIDDTNNDKRTNTEGQMNLFEFASPGEAEEFAIRYPDVAEFDKEEMLTYEKEVLGIYISGHPLEEYENTWRKNITNTTSDFLIDEETGETIIKDGASVVVGGMVIDKTVKTTKTNSLMAFITVEDLLGSVEVIVFPKDFEKYKKYIDLDAKVFISGRATVEEDRAGKIICSRVIPFDMLPRHLWIRFTDKTAYLAGESDIMDIMGGSDGTDRISIYLEKEKQIKHLPMSMGVCADNELVSKFKARFGTENIQVVEKKIE